VHAKTQGILEGYLEVDAHLPCDSHRIVRKAWPFSIVMRFSTVPGDIRMTACRRPRSIGKTFGVEGGDSVDPKATSPRISFWSTARFWGTHSKKFLAGYNFDGETDRAQGLKKWSALMRQCSA